MRNNNITIVTDSATEEHLDTDLYQGIIVDNKIDHNTRFMRDGKVTWKQTNRATAYEHSPYDKTLLLDVDYLIFTDTFDTYFVTENMDIAFGTQSVHAGSYKPMNEMVGNLHMAWATMMMFTKSREAEMYFDYMEYVRENYAYFSQLYGFSNVAQFRNDYALTIANKELNMWGDMGPNTGHRIHAIGHYDQAEVKFTGLQGRWIISNGNDSGTFSYMDTTDLHIMDKDIIFDNYKAINEWRING